MPTLNRIGKEAIVKHHKNVPFRLPEPIPKLSHDNADSGDLIVRGDNLHALKALLAETGTGYTAKADSPLPGEHEGRAICLFYNGILKDKPIAGSNVLTSPVFGILPQFVGPKIIHATTNRISGRAAGEGIMFKQTPYALEL